jgi:transposase
VRRMGRIGTSARELRAFADQLETTDHVVVESTAFTWALVELRSERAGRVTVSNPMRTQAIASAKVKTDKVDAKVLAQLGAADFLPGVWAPDRATLALRRQIAHRASLVRQRTRLRNQVHAVLGRNFVEVPSLTSSASEPDGSSSGSSSKTLSERSLRARCDSTTRSRRRWRPPSTPWRRRPWPIPTSGG